MTQRLIFVRHGESEANIARVIANRDSGHSLTALGRSQAAQTARALRSERVTRMFSSPLRRAVETAEVLAEILEVSFSVREELREFDCGVCEGRGDESAWEQHSSLFDAWVLEQRPERRIDGGEDLVSIVSRLQGLIDELLASPAREGGATVLVGHGGVYRVALPFILGNVEPAFAHSRPLEHGDLVVAEADGPSLWCRQWGDRVFQAS